MARKGTLCVLTALTVLLVGIMPGVAATAEPPQDGAEAPDFEGVWSTLHNATGDAKETLRSTGQNLPPNNGSGNGGNGQGGSGNHTGAAEETADNASATAQDAVIRVREKVNETQQPIADEADATVATVLGALGAILAGALGILARRGDDGGSAGLSDAVVQVAAQNPWAALFVFATSVGLIAGLTWLMRRALPFGLGPLLSRITKDELYENDARRLVADLVSENPGLSLHELVERTEYSRNAISYHLFVLEKEDQITSVKDGKYRRYFPRDGKYVNGAKRVVSVLMNDVSRKIAKFVTDQPGSIQREVCENLGTTPSATCWHAKRLESQGVIRKERDGNMVRYYPGPALEKYDLGEFGLPSPA